MSRRWSWRRAGRRTAAGDDGVRRIRQRRDRSTTASASRPATAAADASACSSIRAGRSSSRTPRCAATRPNGLRDVNVGILSGRLVGDAGQVGRPVAPPRRRRRRLDRDELPAQLRRRCAGRRQVRAERQRGASRRRRVGLAREPELEDVQERSGRLERLSSPGARDAHGHGDRAGAAPRR